MHPSISFQEAMGGKEEQERGEMGGSWGNMLAPSDCEVVKKGRKLSAETYCHRRSCKIEPISHKHAGRCWTCRHPHTPSHSIMAHMPSKSNWSSDVPSFASWWRHGIRLNPGGAVHKHGYSVCVGIVYWNSEVKADGTPKPWDKHTCTHQPGRMAMKALWVVSHRGCNCWRQVGDTKLQN